jgi:hypothetical protein
MLCSKFDYKRNVVENAVQWKYELMENPRLRIIIDSLQGNGKIYKKKNV